MRTSFPQCSHNNHGSHSVSVEFAPEHIVGSLKAEDALKYRAFLEKSKLQSIIGVCDGAVYGKRPDLGRQMVFRLCLALDMDNLRPEDSLSWNKRDYR